MIARSKIHSDHAFCSCEEEAEADAVERAKLEISGLAGEPESDRGQFLDNSLGTVACSESDESLASRFEIAFDGKRYAFRQYRYDQFRDALRYAMLEHTKDGFLRDEAFRPSWASAYRPSDEEEGAMRLHGIDYVDGRYLYGGYCYGRLSDAIAYRLCRGASQPVESRGLRWRRSAGNSTTKPDRVSITQRQLLLNSFPERKGLMLFHCMTIHGFASANVVRSGETIDVNVECMGSSIPLIRYAICFQAPRKQSFIEAKTPEKHFALLALSYFNFTANPAPCTSTQLAFEDLVLDESLVLSEAV